MPKALAFSSANSLNSVRFRAVDCQFAPFGANWQSDQKLFDPSFLCVEVANLVSHILLVDQNLSMDSHISLFNRFNFADFPLTEDLDKISPILPRLPERVRPSVRCHQLRPTFLNIDLIHRGTYPVIAFSCVMAFRQLFERTRDTCGPGGLDHLILSDIDV